jgi:hypothetical protein
VGRTDIKKTGKEMGEKQWALSFGSLFICLERLDKNMILLRIFFLFFCTGSC